MSPKVYCRFEHKSTGQIQRCWFNRCRGVCDTVDLMTKMQPLNAQRYAVASAVMKLAVELAVVRTPVLLFSKLNTTFFLILSSRKHFFR